MSEAKRSVMESKGSYYVSVPADWVQQHGLKKMVERGTLLYSLEKEGELIDGV